MYLIVKVKLYNSLILYLIYQYCNGLPIQYFTKVTLFSHWGSFDVAILKKQARGGLAIFAALSWLDINKISSPCFSLVVIGPRLVGLCALTKAAGAKPAWSVSR